MNKKLLVPILAFTTDAALSFYTYIIFTNYEQFQKYAKMTINDPDFQLEIYKVMLQSLTFILILFLFFHFIIYLFYYRGSAFAKKYVRFYLITAIASLGISMLFSFDLYFFMAILSFVFCFSKLKTAE
jgi:hypothetical protein